MSALSFKARVDHLLHASLPVCIGFLRFTSGVTPADLLIEVYLISTMKECKIGTEKICLFAII